MGIDVVRCFINELKCESRSKQNQKKIKSDVNATSWFQTKKKSNGNNPAETSVTWILCFRFSIATKNIGRGKYLDNSDYNKT